MKTIQLTLLRNAIKLFSIVHRYITVFTVALPHTCTGLVTIYIYIKQRMSQSTIRTFVTESGANVQPHTTQNSILKKELCSFRILKSKTSYKDYLNNQAKKSAWSKGNNI
jgi:hypothetical protein